MNKLLDVLDEIEEILWTIQDAGSISEPLIDLLRKQINKGRRWLIRNLRKLIGPLNNETKKWVRIALTLISLTRTILVLNDD